MKNLITQKSSACYGKTSLLLSFLFIFLFFITSCKDDDQEDVAPIEEPAGETFEAVIASGGVPEKVEDSKVELDSTEQEELMPDGSLWKCTTKKYSVTQGASDFPLFNPNASVVYPGSLLQGKTLSSATPSVIPVKRAGGTVSIDIIDGSLQPAFTVDEVKKSTISTAVNQIISESTGVVPANFSMNIAEVQSQEQLALELGVDVETKFVEVASQFSFSEDKDYNRFLVQLTQSYYTMSFDIPTSNDELFAAEVTPDDLKPYVGPGNPATFISDVTYGRVYYMLIESTSSVTEMDLAIQSSFNHAVASVDIDLDVSHLESLSELKIKVTALGGESASTFATIGETNIGDLVGLLGESSDIRTGVPLSYVVRSVVDKEIVSVKLATEYEVKNCTPLALALDKPILWFDAADLDILSPDNPCTDCLYEYGVYEYISASDAYKYDILSGTGTVVKKWQDLSGNGYNAHSIDGDILSPPMYNPNAFDNGLPAVEFYGPNKLSFSGVGFVNTDYTIFAVVSRPDEVNIRQDLEGHPYYTTFANLYGSFISGSSNALNQRLEVGFLNKSKFKFSHHGSEMIVEESTLQASGDFRVIALTFSKTEGMAVYVNGTLVTKDPNATEALTAYTGAFLSAGFGNSRIKIAEIQAYGVAATDEQVAHFTKQLNIKYGL